MNYESILRKELDPIQVEGSGYKYGYVNRPLLGSEKMRVRGMFTKFLRESVQASAKMDISDSEVALMTAFAEAMADEKFIAFIKKVIIDVNIQPGLNDKPGDEYSFDEWFGIRDEHIFPLAMGIYDQNFKRANQLLNKKKESQESPTHLNTEEESSASSPAYETP